MFLALPKTSSLWQLPGSFPTLFPISPPPPSVASPCDFQLLLKSSHVIVRGYRLAALGLIVQSG